MIDEDPKYRIESEIDKAIPYLEKLNAEIIKLERNKPKITTNESNKSIFKNIFKRKVKTNNTIYSTEVVEKRKFMKSKNFKKDGYYFKILLYKVFNELDESQILYYEFYANIKFVNENIRKQFYRKFFNNVEAIAYFKDMTSVFRILSRRQLMERLFKEKEEEIKSLKNNN